MTRGWSAIIGVAALSLGSLAGVLVTAKPAHVPPPDLPPTRAPEPPPPRPASEKQPSIIASPTAGLVQARTLAAQPPPVLSLKLSRRVVLETAARCAPLTPGEALASIVQVESGNGPLKIGVNGRHRRSYEPASADQAADLAARLMAAGENIDLGLAQINSRNLGWLGLSIAQAFDPCQNLAAAGQIIDQGYRAALRTSPPDRSVLQTAYSLYNTGDAGRGLRNGYVDAVERALKAGGERAAPP